MVDKTGFQPLAQILLFPVLLSFHLQSLSEEWGVGHSNGRSLGCDTEGTLIPCFSHCRAAEVLIPVKNENYEELTLSCKCYKECLV